MDRYYLEKKNVENQFSFYRLIQLLLDECLRKIGMQSYRMNKVFRGKLYLKFLQYETVFIQARLSQNSIIVSFILKRGEEEAEFGRLSFESAKIKELYSLF